MNIKIRRAKEIDLMEIKKLQEQNHFSNLSEEEKKKEGFVSVETDLETLIKINRIGIIVAEINSKIIGYEFPLEINLANDILLLKPFIKKILKLQYKNKKIEDYNPIIAGQICIDKDYKRLGIASKMHKKFLEMLKNKYDLLVTEISNQNQRSYNCATKNLGLKVIEEYTSNNKKWYILVQEI